jgi:hypothetical protein
MSAAQSHAFDAIAFQLVAALEKYDADADAMVDTWPDLELYRGVSAQIESIRMYSAALPEVRVQWVQLLIAHAELVHFLWREKYGERLAPDEGIAGVRENHRDAVAALRNRCLRFIQRGQRFAAGHGARYLAASAVPAARRSGRAGF